MQRSAVWKMDLFKAGGYNLNSAEGNAEANCKQLQVISPLQNKDTSRNAEERLNEGKYDASAFDDI